MKVVIFAGGFGRRLWPISLSSSPKQFEPIIGDRSTIQLAVDRVWEQFGGENIFISTNERYADIIRHQLPMVPDDNVIGEPMRRDLAAAVGLAMIHLQQVSRPGEPVAILWGDNYMKEVDTFRSVMATAEQVIQDKKAKIVFMGETPRFANANLGWIDLGEQRGQNNGRPFYNFGGLTYRPPQDQCDEMFAAGNFVWNTGYFVTSVDYITAAYQKFMPEMWQILDEIGRTIGHEAYQSTLNRLYPQMESISFDDAILTHLNNEDAGVLHAPMGWSDPGTLYALKESIDPDPSQNVNRGLVIDNDSSDCLIYNYESDKLIVAPGLEGFIIVNTPQSILVVHKDNIRQVKEIVEGFSGSDLERYS
ncbi:MAG: sugar phosphate nucleotidyltransferase [Ardenticatenaceae bacterium]|nr:sugar phosphate nucleotidyltransferase [Ardenticatenaceae bacterium]